MMTAMLTVENIVAGSRVFNIWNVNEDAEYHEAGDEGEQIAIAVPLSEDRVAALTSERDVPKRILAADAIAGDDRRKVGKAA